MRTENQEHDMETEAALASVVSRIESTDKPLFFLSDFDLTLCDAYTYVPTRNDHLPQISPAIIQATRNHNLLIATSRRLDNIGVANLWQSGLVPEHQPVIVENGGMIAICKNGEVQGIDLIPQEDKKLLQEASTIIREGIQNVSADQRLVIKSGRTLLISRIQNKDGEYTLQDQAILARQIRSLIPFPTLQVTDTRSSVVIHSKRVNKRSAFLKYLELSQIDRSSIFVIGMGDADNDKEIFASADLSVGFSPIVKDVTDVVLPQGAKSTAAFFNTISRSLAKNNKMIYNS